ncbi:hypothetical protein Mterra_02058 [Calidithermus terrae]|uniref:Uncharacterized protein n=1 Tax=Calidithermus terrae TaxID=1408545 RepID=A0A399EKF5_9DEIN|nr:hypothetical protein Mterra_02058 [Calidithermus terrae]
MGRKADGRLMPSLGPAAFTRRGGDGLQCPCGVIGIPRLFRRTGPRAPHRRGLPPRGAGRSIPLPASPLPPGAGLRRGDGHRDFQVRPHGGGLRRRALQRLPGDAQPGPARRDRPHPPQLPRGRRRRDRDQHLRGLPPRAGGVRARGRGRRPGLPGRPRRPRGGRPPLHPREAPLRGRFAGAGHQAHQPGADRLAGDAGVVPRGRPRPDPGWGGRAADRDRPGHPPGALRGAGGACGHAGRGARGAPAGAGHGGVHRDHARRHRRQRRPDRARGPPHRRHRDELCHRPRPDGLARPLLLPELHPLGLLPAQRRPAPQRGGTGGLRPHPRRAGALADEVRARVRPQRGGRLLRHRPRAHPRPGGGAGQPPAGREDAGAVPGAGGEPLPGSAAQAGHRHPHRGGAHQRHGEQEVPRAAVRRRLRGDARARPGAGGRRGTRARRLGGLDRPRRGARHARGREALRHQRANPHHDRLHPDRRDAGGARAPGGPGHPQLGQPRGRPGEVRQGGLPRPPARSGPGGAHHRRGQGSGHGEDARAQGRDRPADVRAPYPGPRHPGQLDPLRPAHLPHHPGRRGHPQAGHVDHRGHPQGARAAARGGLHPGRLQRLLRGLAPSPRGAQLGLPRRVHQGRAHGGHPQRGQDPAHQPDPRGAVQARPRPHLRPPRLQPRRLRGPRPALRLRGLLRQEQGRAIGRRRPLRRARRGGAPEEAHHRGAQGGPRGRPRGRPAGGLHPGLGHQRGAAGGHEGGGRPLRRGQDATPLRAPGRRDHEGGGALPRAQDGPARGRPQGHHGARHRQGRRARHRQEPRGHHPLQQRLPGGEPGHQEAHRGDPGRRRGAPAPGGGHERPLGQEHGGDEGEPRVHARAGLPHPRGARRRGAQPPLRRARPAPGLRHRPRLLRLRRLRRPAADGRAHRPRPAQAHQP